VLPRPPAFLTRQARVWSRPEIGLGSSWSRRQFPNLVPSFAARSSNSGVRSGVPRVHRLSAERRDVIRVAGHEDQFVLNRGGCQQRIHQWCRQSTFDRARGDVRPEAHDRRVKLEDAACEFAFGPFDPSADADFHFGCRSPVRSLQEFAKGDDAEVLLVDGFALEPALDVRVWLFLACFGDDVGVEQVAGCFV
jgi:hypothetical protein